MQVKSNIQPNVSPLCFNDRKANRNKLAEQLNNLLCCHHVLLPNNMLHLKYHKKKKKSKPEAKAHTHPNIHNSNFTLENIAH